jgi:NADP-dependent 3-hydroxy acid dehydrogenase YdfG
MGRFDGRVAVITGAARGIGFGTAQRFASEGASVAVVDLDEAAATEAASRIEVAVGAQAIGIGCDVSDSAAAESAIQQVVEGLGGIHILVNNAGITRDNLLFKMTEDDWDLVMAVHLKGPFNMTKAAQKHFVEQRYGKILNLSSVSALGNRGQANYSAAKMGIQGFTRTLGIELGPLRHQRQRHRARVHRHRDDRRDRRPGQDERRGLPGRGGGVQPRASGRFPRGHRGSGGVPVQRRGLLHHGSDVVRRRRSQLG